MRYCQITVLFCLLVFTIICEAHLSDKWDENVRPKMVFSYLEQQTFQSKAKLIFMQTFRVVNDRTRTEPNFSLVR